MTDETNRGHAPYVPIFLQENQVHKGRGPDLLTLRPHLDGRPNGAADDFARHNQLHAAILLPAG